MNNIKSQLFRKLQSTREQGGRLDNEINSIAWQIIKEQSYYGTSAEWRSMEAFEAQQSDFFYIATRITQHVCSTKAHFLDIEF